MAQSNAGTGPGELGICGWIAFWAQFVMLGVLAVVGAFFASASDAPGDEACGLALSLAAIALAFLRIKRRFDGETLDWDAFLFVDDMPNLVLAIIVFVVLAILGLCAAARVDYGGLHDGGVALSVVSALGVFLSMKRVFDNLDRQH